MELSSLSLNRKRGNDWLGFVLANKAERFNTISALLGAIAAVSGIVWLVTLAVRQGDPWKIASFSVYGVTLILVYVLATLYHGSNGRVKAGTYTPFTLVTLRDSVGGKNIWHHLGNGTFLNYFGLDAEQREAGSSSDDLSRDGLADGGRARPLVASAAHLSLRCGALLCRLRYLR